MSGDVTRILNAIEQGDAQAADDLLPLVYQELRRLAAQKLSKESPGQTLQATALVHEAYIRLVGTESANWDGQGHFFAAAAEAMRRILIDNARRKRSLKHGGDRQKVGLDHAVAIVAFFGDGEIDSINKGLCAILRGENAIFINKTIIFGEKCFFCEKEHTSFRIVL